MQLRSHWAADTATPAVGSSAAAVDWQGSSGGWRQNCILCWNYLYLSQKLAEIDDPVKREEFLKAVAHGSAAAWEHVNLLGEYDLSKEKFKDSVGIKPPKLTD
jgi:Tn3 transposase DDE domain